MSRRILARPQDAIIKVLRYKCQQHFPPKGSSHRGNKVKKGLSPALAVGLLA
jgi:hypothetical protein